ncbi:MAG: hypothetical protein LBS99_00845 [Clostridiales bacterium]|nr:hypothetical protein [Clostridiales bacterium]
MRRDVSTTLNMTLIGFYSYSVRVDKVSRTASERHAKRASGMTMRSNEYPMHTRID